VFNDIANTLNMFGGIINELMNLNLTQEDDWCYTTLKVCQ
jgi:hypothetical protein